MGVESPWNVQLYTELLKTCLFPGIAFQSSDYPCREKTEAGESLENLVLEEWLRLWLKAILAVDLDDGVRLRFV